MLYFSNSIIIQFGRSVEGALTVFPIAFTTFYSVTFMPTTSVPWQSSFTDIKPWCISDKSLTRIATHNDGHWGSDYLAIGY